MIYRISDNFEVRPHGNNLCWELWEKRLVNQGKPEKADKWVFTRKYPQNMKHALEIALEIQLKRGDQPLHGLKASIEHVRKTAESLKVREYDEACHCINADVDGLGECDQCASYMEVGDFFCPGCGRPKGEDNVEQVYSALVPISI